MSCIPTSATVTEALGFISSPGCSTGGKDGPGLEPGKFLAPHGLAIDSKGDIYVGEVSYTNWKTSFPDTPMPPYRRLLPPYPRA